MTDNIQYIDVDSDEFIDAPRALREHVKKLQSRLTRVTETNEDLRGRLTASALTDVLAEFKNPERVKRDLLSDKIDPLDGDAVKQWLSDNGGDYAKGEGAPSSPAEPAVDDGDREAHERLAAASGDLTDPSTLTKMQAAQAEITPDMDGRAVEAVYRKHGL